MNDEFKKLDAFMEKNRPPAFENTKALKPAKQRRLILQSALALGICGVVLWGVLERRSSDYESSYALYEVLSWDLTQEDFPQELEDSMVMAGI